MISSNEAQELHAAIGSTLMYFEFDLKQTDTPEVWELKRALELAAIIVSDLTGDPNVVERTAHATFEMTDLVPLLPVGEAPGEEQ